MKMIAIYRGKPYEVKETNGRYFYWSPLAMRWLPCKKADVRVVSAEGVC